MIHLVLLVAVAWLTFIIAAAPILAVILVGKLVGCIDKS